MYVWRAAQQLTRCSEQGLLCKIPAPLLAAKFSTYQWGKEMCNPACPL